MDLVSTVVKPIKSYLVWEDVEFNLCMCIEISSVKRELLEMITLEGYVYAEVKAITEDEARHIFILHYDFLQMYKLKDSQAFVLRKSFVRIESRFYC